MSKYNYKIIYGKRLSLCNYWFSEDSVSIM